MALIGHFHVAATSNKFYLTSTEALCILLFNLFNVQVLNQVLPSRRDPMGDTVVRQSHLRFLEATLALMFAASLTYAQTTSGFVVASIADATGICT